MQWYCQLLQSIQKVELSFTSFNAWHNKTKILRDNPCYTVQFSRILFHSSIVRQAAQKIVQCNRAFSFTNLDTYRFRIKLICTKYIVSLAISNTEKALLLHYGYQFVQTSLIVLVFHLRWPISKLRHKKCQKHRRYLRYLLSTGDARTLDLMSIIFGTGNINNYVLPFPHIN